MNLHPSHYGSEHESKENQRSVVQASQIYIALTVTFVCIDHN